MDAILAIVGLFLLLAGGETLVRGGMAMSARLRMPTAVVGAVVLGFGTSMPELLTSLSAAWAGSPGIAIGNVVGSNIANILLILGLAIVISPVTSGAAPREDMIWLAGSTALAIALLFFLPTLGHAVGAGLLILLAVYIWRSLARDAAGDLDLPDTDRAGALIAGQVLLGIGILIAGAALLVEGATGIARAWGISETVIGLTLVAVGTSLPELATSVVAARRGQAGLAVGNVLGSNIFNILAIFGLTAAILPIPVPPMLSLVDLALLGGSAVFLLLLLSFGRMGRRAGMASLAVYAGYVVWLASRGV